MLAYSIIALLAAAAVLLRKLTLIGGITGALVAAAMYLGCGLAGIVLVGAFFILGTLATGFRSQQKLSAGLKEANGGARNAVQVLANGGVAALAAILTYRYGWPFAVVTASALSAATADTLSSELGNVLGRSYVDLRSLRRGRRGQDGVISLEGSLCGLGGSIVIALLSASLFPLSIRYALLIIVAGTFGNLLDSVLGATLQRRGYLNNDAVNAINTLGAAAFAVLLA